MLLITGVKTQTVCKEAALNRRHCRRIC